MSKKCKKNCLVAQELAVALSYSVMPTWCLLPKYVNAKMDGNRKKIPLKLKKMQHNKKKKENAETTGKNVS